MSAMPLLDTIHGDRIGKAFQRKVIDDRGLHFSLRQGVTGSEREVDLICRGDCFDAHDERQQVADQLTVQCCDIAEPDHDTHRQSVIAFAWLPQPRCLQHGDRRFGGGRHAGILQPIAVAGRLDDLATMIGSVAGNERTMFAQQRLVISSQQSTEPGRGPGDIGLHQNGCSQHRPRRPEASRRNRNRTPPLCVRGGVCISAPAFPPPGSCTPPRSHPDHNRTTASCSAAAARARQT